MTTVPGPPLGGQTGRYPTSGVNRLNPETLPGSPRSLRRMSNDAEQTEPVMDGATDATNHEKLSGLIEQVNHDHGHEGAASMADHLRDRMDETGVEDEDRGDTED